MQRSDRLTRCTGMICMAVALMLLLCGAPVLATETDVKEEKPASEPAPIANAAAGADSKDGPDTGVCRDENVEITIDVNTLEDIFALSSANLATILEDSSEKTGEKKPATDEVRWQTVDSDGD